MTAKPKPEKIIVGENLLEAGSPTTRTWDKSPGTYISGRAYLDEADALAAALEAKWGVDRLRLLVSPDLREKFDRQRYLVNRATWHGDLEDVRREASRMANAWRTLDRFAEAAGAKPLAPEVWEVALEDGSVAAIVRSNADAHAVIAQSRNVRVYTLEEIAKLIAAQPKIAAIKQVWPGATVTAIRQTPMDDPLDGIFDTAEPLD